MDTPTDPVRPETVSVTVQSISALASTPAPTPVKLKPVVCAVGLAITTGWSELTTVHA